MRQFFFVDADYEGNKLILLNLVILGSKIRLKR